MMELQLSFVCTVVVLQLESSSICLDRDFVSGPVRVVAFFFLLRALTEPMLAV